MGSVRPPNDYELKQLRAFQRQVERLRQSKIVQAKGLNAAYMNKVDLGTGEHSVSFEGFDPDAFQAQLPIIRQFILNDPINYGRIHNVINQCCPRQELVQWTRVSYGRWKKALATVPREYHKDFHGVRLTLEEAIERLFYGYGELFHVDIDSIGETETVKAIEQGLFQEAFPDLWWCLNALDSVINWWLDEPLGTVPTPPLE